MDRMELILVDHPPHRRTSKKLDLSRRILPKVVLFFAIFILSFHLFPFSPVIQRLTDGLETREETIREILTVLDRYPMGLTTGAKEELARVIYEESNRYNHDPKFILALIATESSFQNWSVSERGAKGLMQIMPYVAESIAREMGIEWRGDRTLFNPYLNIRIGIYYLSRLTVDFNDTPTALTAYNYGPTYVKSLMERKERIPIEYYRKILNVYWKL